MDTATEYKSITGNPSKWLPAVVTAYPQETHFSFLSIGSPDNLPLMLHGPSSQLEVATITNPNFSQHGQKFLTLKIPHKPDNSHVKDFPVFHHRGEAPFMDVIVDFPGGDKLSEFYKMYLVAYILGMLVRYFPSKWMTLLRGGPGDLVKPLLFKAIEAVETGFAEQLTQQIPEHPTTI